MIWHRVLCYWYKFCMEYWYSESSIDFLGNSMNRVEEWNTHIQCVGEKPVQSNSYYHTGMERCTSILHPEHFCYQYVVPRAVIKSTWKRGRIWMPKAGPLPLLLHFLFYHLIYFIFYIMLVLHSIKHFNPAASGILQNLQLPSPCQKSPTILSICYFTHIHCFNGIACFYFLASVAGCHLSNNV